MKSGFLSEFLGSTAAELVLLHLYHYGETYGRAASRDMGISLLTVQQQLDKFERSGFLVSKEQGRTRLYSWNPKNPFTESIKSLVKIQYEGITLDTRQKLFSKRRRPRRKGKPVLQNNT